MKTIVTEETDRLMGRNGSIWREHVRGATHEALAEKYNLSPARIGQITKQVADSIPQRERDQVIAEEIDLFRRLRLEVLELWDMPAAPVTAGKDAEFVTDPQTGTIVRDHSGRLNAIRVAQQLSERMARLLGIDAAQKVETTVVDESAEVAKAAEEAARRVAGAP